MSATTFVKPRDMKPGMVIKVDGEWLTTESVVMLPGGGTRTAGTRRGQYIIRAGGREITASGRGSFETRATTDSPEKCPVCVYGEPADHTCDEGQQHRYRVETRGRI